MSDQTRPKAVLYKGRKKEHSDLKKVEQNVLGGGFN